MILLSGFGALPTEILAGQLASIDSTRTDHANLMVGEHRMCLGHLIFRHMAGDAIAGRHLAYCPRRMCPLGLPVDPVARQAFRVIGSRFVNKWLMRVVTGHAGNPSVATSSPAAAFLKPIRLKAYQPGARRARRLHHIRPCAMACPAKVDRIRGGKIRRIHDRRPLLRVIRSHGRNVAGSRSMARFTGNPRLSFLRFQQRGSNSRGCMTFKAADCSVNAHLSAQRTFQAIRHVGSLSWSNVQGTNVCEKTQTALKVSAVFLKDISLSILESKSPTRRQGHSINSVSRAENDPFKRGRDRGAEAAFFKLEQSMICQ
jgi:hypothetical protein